MQKYEDFTSEYQETLQDILSNWKENLTRNLTHDTSRDFFRFETKTFENVGITQNKAHIFLENIRLLAKPQFTLDNLDVSFKNLSLEVAYKLNDFNLECDFNLSSSNRRQQGKIRFTLKHPSAKGRVGMVFVEDSFMPTNYDINYNAEEVVTEAFNFAPSEGNADQNFNLNDYIEGFDGKTIDTSLVSLFWCDIETFLDDYMQRFIAGNVVEYSVQEMFCDEPDMIKGYEESRTMAANEIFDKTLEKVKGCIAEKSEMLHGDAFKLSTKIGNKDCKIESAPSQLKDWSSLHRVSKATCFEDGDTCEYYAVVALHDYSYALEGCKIVYGELSINGSIVLNLDYNRCMMKFKISKETQEKLHLKLIELGDSEIEAKIPDEHSATFNRIKDKVSPYIIGHFRYNSNAIQRKIVERFNQD